MKPMVVASGKIKQNKFRWKITRTSRPLLLSIDTIIEENAK